MKKLLSILVAASLLIALLMPAAFAAGGETVVEVSSVIAEAGDEVTVEVSISNNSGFSSAKFTIEYDSSVLTLTKLENGLLNGASNIATGQVNHAATSNTTEDGVLFTATFTVKEGAAKGTYDVEVVVNKLTKLDGTTPSAVTPEVENGTVTVDCDCVDEDDDCVCDKCDDALDHVDDDGDCVCDVCDTALDHVDDDDDGVCDVCEEELSHRDDDEDCVCDNCGEDLDHVDDDNDGVCDVCEEELSHRDEDGDSVCDNCGDVLDHTCTSDSEWKTNGTYHWHEACDICGAEKFDRARHTFENKVCTVCGYEQKTSTGGGGYVQPSMPFTDVNPGDWFYENVRYVYNANLMNGTNDGTTFSPNMNMNRAMLVTVLYRMAGEPAVTAKNTFPDVADGTWYTKAVIWASTNGIVTGDNYGNFLPNGNVTREQLATFLYRFAQYKGHDVTAKGDLTTFPDNAITSGWAKEATEWAVGVGVIQGRNGNNLQPTTAAVRSEVAAMLHRFCLKF